jgi:hypothetical protein
MFIGKILWSKNRSKWDILFKVLPFTGLFAIAKFGIHWLGWESWSFDALTGALFSAATFTIALVLSGTLGDYRASEGMPSAIANALENIQATNRVIAAADLDYQAQPLQQALIDVSQSILNWLESGGEFAIVDKEIDEIDLLLAPMLNLNGGAILINRIQAEQATIRSITRQMQGNRDTEFLGPAYVLLWLFLCGSIVALLLIKGEPFTESLTISTFIFTAFFYLLFFIQDLDNPFEYDGKSCVDVDLSALKNVLMRLTSEKL